MAKQIDSNPALHDHILWSDLSMFDLNRTGCHHNNVVEAVTIPHNQFEVPHTQQSVMVGFGLTSNLRSRIAYCCAEIPADLLAIVCDFVLGRFRTCLAA